MIASIRRLLELVRFSHTVFALPFALLGAVMAWAETPFRWRDLVGILLCMVFARSAAMAFNRLVDRHYDALNPRTANRHLPRGEISPGTVILFTVVCCVGFIASTLIFLPNRWPIAASIPVLLFLLGYSYTKRFTELSHFWLGTALMLAPIAAWVAIAGRPAAAPVVLGLAVLFWVAGFDMIYACQDAEFDRKVRLRSIPARLGVRRTLRLSALCHAFVVALLASLPLWYPLLGTTYLIGVGIITVLLVYEHSVVRPDDLSRVNVAFFHVNAVISIGVLVIGTVDIWFL
ncbi:MAG: 4-hydroxybenzoate octaprenyltransferase [Planctomycetota bacterium]|nr:MAG: 4-hydroxybenzoate octaprenyltransferase [Planctomycetota bacterium]